MKKLVNGKIVDCTDWDIAQAKIDSENYEKEKQFITNKENKKASGKQKLKDLGLSDDEVEALL